MSAEDKEPKKEEEEEEEEEEDDDEEDDAKPKTLEDGDEVTDLSNRCVFEI